MRTILVGLMFVLGVLCSAPSSAAPFLDDFSTDTSGNYTSTDLLKNSVNAGAAVRSIDAGDSNALVIGNPTRTAGVLQTTFMHNTASLAVGETAMLDIVSGTQVSLEAVGLVVSRINPITTTVVTGSSGQQDAREGTDYVTSSLRLSNDTYQSERWAGTSPGSVTTGPFDPSEMSGVYVQRLAEDVFTMGYLDAEGGLVPQGRYDNAAFTSAGAFVGIYSDMRSASSEVTVDNLRIAAVDTPVLTIDRQTGQITLSKFGTTDYALLGYELSSPTSGSFSQAAWLSISDNYDMTSTGGPGPVDFNDDWTVNTAPGDATDLSEYNYSTDPGDGGVLSHTAPINLGQAWLRTPFEDVTAKISIDTGGETQVIDVDVLYTGVAISAGDLTGDGAMTAADYAAFLAGQGNDFTGLSQAEAYVLGDLNGDLKHDIFDFVAFESAYDLANGAGALAALVSHSVPEPGSVVLLLLGATTLLGMRSAGRCRSLCVAAVVTAGSLLAANTASAIIFLDDFSTDTSSNYTRIAGLARTASVLPTMTIAGEELTLTSPGHGTPNSGITQTYILHNTATLSVGERLLVDVDLLNGDFGSDVSELIGLTLVAQGNFPGIDPVPPGSNQDVRDTQVANLHAGFRNGRHGIEGRDRFRTDAFNGPDVAGKGPAEQTVDLGITADNADPNLANIKSMYITRTATNTYAMGWVDQLGVFNDVRTIADFDLGATPRIGLFTDTRSDDLNQTVDNLRIQAAVLSLLVDPSNGLMRLENQTGSPISLDSYQIASAMGNLNAGSWTSLYDQDLAGFPGGSTPTDPDGWVEVPNPDSGYLAEYFLNDEEVGLSTLGAGESILLGPAYTGGGELSDLSLSYHDVTTGKIATVVEGLIQFGTIDLPSFVPGDYDNNGYVDANDYTEWKSAFGDSVTPGSGADGNSDGVVDAADYTVWRNNLGAGTPPAALLGATAVPEPGSLWLVLGCVAVVGVGLRKGFRVDSRTSAEVR